MSFKVPIQGLDQTGSGGDPNAANRWASFVSYGFKAGYYPSTGATFIESTETAFTFVEDYGDQVTLPDDCLMFTASHAGIVRLPLPGKSCLRYSAVSGVGEIPQGDVDSVLVALAANGLENGYVDLAACAEPTQTGIDAVKLLWLRGWSVEANWPDWPMFAGFSEVPADGTVVLGAGFRACRLNTATMQPSATGDAYGLSADGVSWSMIMATVEFSLLWEGGDVIDFCTWPAVGSFLAVDGIGTPLLTYFQGKSWLNVSV